VGCRIVSDENTSFWSDPWLEGGVLRDRFRRLFELSVDPNVFMAVMRRDMVGRLTGWIGGGEEDYLHGRRNN
jgi:hypothetical protein